MQRTPRPSSLFSFPIDNVQTVPYAEEEAITREDVKKLVKRRFSEYGLPFSSTLVDDAFGRHAARAQSFVRVGESTSTVLAVIAEKDEKDQDCLSLTTRLWDMTMTATRLERSHKQGVEAKIEYKFDQVCLIVLNLKKEGYNTPSERLFAFSPFVDYEFPYTPEYYKELVFAKMCEAAYLFDSREQNGLEHKASLCAAFRLVFLHFPAVQHCGSINELTLARCLHKFIRWSLDHLSDGDSPLHHAQLLRREIQALVDLIIDRFDDDMQLSIISYMGIMAHDGRFHYEEDIRCWVVTLFRNRYKKTCFWKRFWPFFRENCTDTYEEVGLAHGYYSSCLNLAYLRACHHIGSLTDVPKPGAAARDLRDIELLSTEVQKFRDQFLDYNKLQELVIVHAMTKLENEEVTSPEYEIMVGGANGRITKANLLLNTVSMFAHVDRARRSHFV